MRTSLTLAGWLAVCACGAKGPPSTELLSVVAISRHGIRSQTPPLAQLNLYTQHPEGFPLWPAPADVPGNLSTKGAQNVERLGAWYRDYYSGQGLLPPRGTCPAAGTVFAYSDVMDRTVRTAQSYLHGMFKAEAAADCGVEVLHASGKADRYIDAPQAGVCRVDSAADQAAFAAATGNDLPALTKTWAAELQTMQTVTACCKPAACATTANPSPSSCALVDLPSEVSVDAASGMVGFGPLFALADATAETFLLEYAEGMPETGCATSGGAACVGWGAIPPGGLDGMMKLHVKHFDLVYRLPSVAQAGSSNLLTQLVGTLEQAVTGTANADLLAPVTSRFSLFVAHDVNLTLISAVLGLTWKAEGFQQDDPSPAGALVFELHRVRASGQLLVRLFFVTATLEQMRNGTELTLETPPQRVPVLIPACGGIDCTWDQFKTSVRGHVREDCVTKGGFVP